MEHVTWTWRIKKHVVAFFARLPHLPNSLFFHMEDIVEIVLANIDIKKEMEILSCKFVTRLYATQELTQLTKMQQYFNILG